MAIITTKSVEAWKYLNGFLSVYKPSGMDILKLSAVIKHKMCGDLNQLESRPPKKIVKLIESPNPETPPQVLSVMDYADHPLVVGQRYQKKDIRLFAINNLNYYSCGVVGFGVGDACYKASKYKAAQYASVYRIQGQLGVATHNMLSTGRLLVKTKTEHITPRKFDVMISNLQNQYQMQTFKNVGVPIESQAAFDIASLGLARAYENKSMSIYSIKVTEFSNPYFTLEVYCINPYDNELLQIVNDLGVSLKSTAITLNMQSYKYGHFTMENSLVKSEWNLGNIIKNISLCKDIMANKNLEFSPYIKIENAPKKVDTGVN